MKRIYLFSALGGLLLASCANDDLVVKPQSPDADSQAAISFESRMGNMSRASLETVMDNFGVWAIKGKGDTDFSSIDLNPSTMSSEVVMPNYKVVHSATSSSYGSGWDYVMNSPKQYLKYWDGSYTNTYFFPYGPWNSSAILAFGSDSESNPIATLTLPEYTMSDDADYAYVYGKVQKETNADHIAYSVANPSTADPKKVPITFKRLFSQLQVAIYEDIPGYKVKMNAVTFSDATTGNIVAIPADCNTTDGSTSVWSRGQYVNKTTPVVVYSGNNFATTELSYTNSSIINEYNNLNFDLPTDEYVSNTNTTPSYSSTIWNVVPVHGVTITNNSSTSLVDKNSGLQFVVNYTLYAEDTKEEIAVMNARVYVPSTYTQWNANTLYTYIFRITKNSSGNTTGTVPTNDPEEPTPCLYPIIFDDVTIEELSTGSDEFEITGLVMNQSTAELHPDETLVLTLTSINIPDTETVTWTSSNPSVVSLPTPEVTTSTCTVTAVAKGTSVITATSTIGGKTYTATCTVNVTAAAAVTP